MLSVTCVVVQAKQSNKETKVCRPRICGASRVINILTKSTDCIETTATLKEITLHSDFQKFRTTEMSYKKRGSKHYLLKAKRPHMLVAFQNILKIAGIPQFLAKMEQLKHYMDIKVQNTQTLQGFFYNKYPYIFAKSCGLNLSKHLDGVPGPRRAARAYLS